MAESRIDTELVAYIVVAILLLVTGYLLFVSVTQQSEWARIIGLVTAVAALFILGKWGYPR